MTSEFICVDEFEQAAYERLPKFSLDYYRSGADDEVTLKDNRKAFKRYKILPRFLRDVSNIQTTTQILGNTTINFPICASPSAMHKLAHPEGELATAEGLSRVGSLMILSTLSTISIEGVADSQPMLTKWFQLYLFKNREKSVELIRRAETSGFSALVLTVDAPVFGLRRNDMRNKFKISKDFLANFDQEQSEDLANLSYIDASITWEDVKWLQGITKLPILLKGILTVEDSLLALEHNVAGIVVSNHGGRQLDSTPATIDVLQSICQAVAGRCEVFVDGGVRTGSDVFKCLALGAKAVFVGRPILWGLACDGADGVEAVLRVLATELATTMKLAGCPTIGDINSSFVVHKSKLH